MRSDHFPTAVALKDNKYLSFVVICKYILLTKREGRTGRISARGLDRYGPSAARSVQKRPRADILPVRSRASLVNKGFITRLETASKENLYTENCYTEEFMKTMCGKTFKERMLKELYIFPYLRSFFQSNKNSDVGLSRCSFY